MLNVKNVIKVQVKPVKPVGVAIQLTDEEIIEFDEMYSLFDVNL